MKIKVKITVKENTIDLVKGEKEIVKETIFTIEVVVTKTKVVGVEETTCDCGQRYIIPVRTGVEGNVYNAVVEITEDNLETIKDFRIVYKNKESYADKINSLLYLKGDISHTESCQIRIR